MIKRLTRDKFLQVYSEVMHKVFRTFDLKEGIFSNSEFQSVCLPQDVFSVDQELMAFVETVRGAGDTSMVLTNVEMLPTHSENLILPVSEESVRQVFEEVETQLGLFSVAMFGASGSWGLLIDKNYECKVFGGSIVNVGELVTRMGGIERVREDFQRFVTDTWSIRAEEQEKILRMYGMEGDGVTSRKSPDEDQHERDRRFGRR